MEAAAAATADTGPGLEISVEHIGVDRVEEPEPEPDASSAVAAGGATAGAARLSAGPDGDLVTAEEVDSGAPERHPQYDDANTADEDIKAEPEPELQPAGSRIESGHSNSHVARAVMRRESSVLDDAHMERIHAIVPRAWYSMATIRFFVSCGWLKLTDDGLTSDRKQAWIHLNSNVSLISTLMFTVAVAGLMFAPEFEFNGALRNSYFTRLHIVYGYFWCFATFCELFASFISLLFLVGANEVENPMQHDHFEKAMGKDVMLLPIRLTVLGFVCMYVALVTHLILTYGQEMACGCVALCMIFMFPFVWAGLKMTWAMMLAHHTDKSIFVGAGCSVAEDEMKRLQKFLLGISFKSVNPDTAAFMLYSQAIDYDLLVLMSDEDICHIPGIAFGDLLRIRAKVASVRRPTSTTK